MARTKKAAKLAKNKKYKKLPLDPTPWEELSKDIKGKFKSKIQTQKAQKHKNQLLGPEDCANSNSIDKSNLQETNSVHSKEVLSENFDDSKNKKIETEFIQNSVHTKVKHDHGNNHSDISIKSSSLENNDCKSDGINNQESSVKQLPRRLKRKLMKQKIFSPISTEGSGAPIQSKAKKLSEKKKLEKKKLFEQKRFERRKELGIMLLPKNIENRLMRIRKALRKKKLPPDEIKTIMRKERSKAQDEFRKSHSNLICFNCRKPGHLVANCPSNEDNKDISICLKCGSTEHKYTMCKQKINGFPFATCFICKDQGHISRDCPKNENGIYPKGGKCNLCDSVNHLRKDCPTLNKKKQSITLDTIDNGTSIDDEVMDSEQSTKKIKSEKPKVVTF